MTYTSVFELFTPGIGPSSSHTVGPMTAAHDFVRSVDLDAVAAVGVVLYGSLGLTGRAHGTGRAVVLGLSGYDAATVPIDVVHALPAQVAEERTLLLDDRRRIRFDPAVDIVWSSDFHPAHPNVLALTARTADGAVVATRTFASIGGGFVHEVGAPPAVAAPVGHPYDVATAAELLAVCRRTGLGIDEVAMANERTHRREAEVRAGIARIARLMDESIDRGMAATGVLPGGLGVRRRAAELTRELTAPRPDRALPPTTASDWAGVYATAVCEENAAGHRIVTAPTNGAAGIVPAVLRFAGEFCAPRAADPTATFLLTATAIGSLIKANAGISGAELGCQGEVGTACSMAAAGLAATLGGSPEQVENAAEIGLEHNLGLTCDPVAGLVQVPCIERNAVGAIKAIAAASMALRGSGEHLVSLDAAIATLRQTGLDMDGRYKETSRGGLAVSVTAC